MDRIELEDWISIICSMLKSNTSEITTLKYDFAECSVFDEEYIELVQNHRISNAFAVSRFTKLERVILTYYISDVKSPFKGQSNPCVKYLKLKKMGITNRWMSDTLDCFRGLNVIELSFCVITLQDGCDTHSFYFDQSFLKLDRIDLVRFRVRRIINEFQHTGYVSYMIVIMKKQRYVRGFLLSEEGSRMLDVDEPTYQTVLREKNTNISLKYVPIIYLMVDQYVKEINFYDSNSSGRKLLENINFDI
jgi:hypothetical protein